MVNVASSITGRYPNLGPQLLMEAGVPLLDEVGPDVFTKVSEGTLVRLQGDTLYTGDEVVAKGRIQTAETVAAAMTAAKEGIAAQLQDFATNTLEYIKGEGEGALLIDGIAAPELRTKIEGRHVLVVVRGNQFREDLAVLRPYIREFKPVMMGVDGGADALLEAGYLPDVIVGDMDSVTDEGLHCGAELVVHAYPQDGRAPGQERVERLGLRVGGLRRGRHQRGRGPADGGREGRQPHRRRGHPQHPGRVPGQGPRRVREHLADPAAGRQQAGGRQGSEPALPAAHLRLGPDAPGAGRPHHHPGGHATPRPAGQIFFTYLGAQWDGVKYWLSGLF